MRIPAKNDARFSGTLWFVRLSPRLTRMERNGLQISYSIKLFRDLIESCQSPGVDYGTNEYTASCNVAIRICEVKHTQALRAHAAHDHDQARGGGRRLALTRSTRSDRDALLAGRRPRYDASANPPVAGGNMDNNQQAAKKRQPYRFKPSPQFAIRPLVGVYPCQSALSP